MTRVALLTAAALVSGCATLSVDSPPRRRIEPRSYATYDWAKTNSMSLDADVMGILDDYFEGAVDKRLTVNGLHKPLAGTPDLLLHARTSLRGIDLAALDRRYRACPSGDCRAALTDYDEVDILLNAVDTRSETIIWQRSARAKLDDIATNPERLKATIDKAVTRMLHGFLPAQSGILAARTIAP
jgi:Domain of unknown function (DUF4136)